jgi:hypothetical protein
MRKTKKEIIDETAAFYNLTNRSVERKNCKYNGPDGNKCAFARVCSDQGLKLLIEGNRAEPNLLSFSEKKLLKPEYLGNNHGQGLSNFWNEIQALHDEESNWTETGLSEKGESVVEKLHYNWDKFRTDSE